MLHVYSCLSVFSINCLNKLSLTKIEGQPRTDNPEKPVTPGNQERTIQRNQQHRAHKTQDKDKQKAKPQTNVLDTATRKHIEIT